MGTHGARIVNVSSDAHYRGRIDTSDLQSRRRYQGFPAYAASKLAVVLYTLELADRIRDTGTTVNALHPGHVATSIYRLWPEDRWYQALLMRVMRRFAISAQEGAQTSIYLASSDKVEGVTGGYYDRKVRKNPSPRCADARLRRSLWELSEQLTG